MPLVAPCCIIVVPAVPCRDLNDDEVEHVAELRDTDVTQGSILLGLVGIVDPIRPEVPAAIAKCHHAGTRQATGCC